MAHWNDDPKFSKNEKRDSIIWTSKHLLFIWSSCTCMSGDATFAIKPRLRKLIESIPQKYGQVFKVVGIKYCSASHYRTTEIAERKISYFSLDAILQHEDVKSYTWLFETLKKWLDKYKLSICWNKYIADFDKPQRKA